MLLSSAVLWLLLVGIWLAVIIGGAILAAEKADLD